MLYLTIGLPRSGKSTFSEEWVKCRPLNGLPRVVVRADDIRKTMGFRYNEYLEEYVHSIKHTMIRALLIGGNDVLVDGTHTSWMSIQKLLEIQPEAKALWISKTLEPHFTEVHVPLCKQRAIDSGQADLIPVIDRMAKQLKQLAVEWDDKIEGYRDRARKKQFNITDPQVINI